MPKQKVTLELDIPEGYEATGEYRRGETGEHWLWSDGSAAGGATACRFLILRKLPAKPAVGTYVVFANIELRRVVSYADYIAVAEKCGRGASAIPEDSIILYCVAADGKPCSSAASNYTPWLPVVGDEVWVDGPTDGSGSIVRGRGRVEVLHNDNSFSITPLGGGRYDNISWTGTLGFALSSLRPIEFAPKKDPKPNTKAMLCQAASLLGKVIETLKGT